MEVLGGVSSIITIVEVSAKISAICLDYYNAVKNARDDITRLRAKVDEVGKVAQDANDLIDTDKGRELRTSKALSNAVTDVCTQVKNIQERLDPKSGRKLMSKFGLRALKWPFERHEVDRIIASLETCRTNISSALQVDQTRILLDIREHIDFDKLPSAPGAAFDAFSDELDPRCHPNTRQDLLKQIQKWANNDKGKLIFWLNGVAGAGKSTISRTVAQKFNDDGILGASFFFKRGESRRDNAGMFCTTIASQLLRKSPELVPHIRDAIKEEPDIATKPLDTQFQNLLLQPLGRLNQNAVPLTLVVDALDECDGDQRIRQLINLLAKLQDLKNVKVRIFLTSRPELPIRLGFNQISRDTHEDLILQDLPPLTIERDISTYLRSEFSKIRDEFNSSHEYSPDSQLVPDWPTEDIIQQLTEMAVPLFIFAATICRFVGDTSDWNPKQRLASVVAYKTIGTASQLDQTYLPVLKQLEAGLSKAQIRRMGQEFRKIISPLVVLADPLSANSLASLLGVSRDEVDGKLHRLHSVLSVPTDPDVPVRLLHLSFREFLVDPDKEEEGLWFYSNEKQIHHSIALRCLEVLSQSLRKNMCSLEHEGIGREDITEKVIQESLPTHVQYACRFWVFHWRESGTSIIDQGPVHVFLRKYFLNWLEALSLLNKVYACNGFIRDLLNLATNADEIALFLADAMRFLSQPQQTISQAPLQVYSSAMIFSPERSLIRETFFSDIPDWISDLPQTPLLWDNELRTFELQGSGISTLSLINNGQHLVTIDRVGRVNHWDIATGEPLRELDWAISGVEFGFKAKFCPKGDHFAILDNSNFIDIWDTNKHVRLKHLAVEGHSNIDFAISSQSRHLVYSSDPEVSNMDSTEAKISFWDISAEKEILHLGDDILGTRQVSTIEFSHDGTIVAVAWLGNEVTLYNTSTSGKIKDFLSPCSGHQMSFSADGRQLAMGAYVPGRYETGVCHVVLLEVPTALALKTFELSGQHIEALKICPGDKLALLASGVVKLWDVAPSQVSITEAKRNDWPMKVTVSPNGKRLVTIAEYGDMIIWDAQTGKELRKLLGREQFIGSSWGCDVVFSPCSGKLAWEWSYSFIRIWETETGERVRDISQPRELSLSLSQVCFSPTSEQLVTISIGRHDFINIIRFVDITDTENARDVNHRIPEQGFYVSAMCFSPNRKQLALGGGAFDITIGRTATDIIVWDIATTTVVAKVALGFDDSIRAISWSPGGHSIASVSLFGVVKTCVWENETWRGDQVFRIPEYPHIIAFSDDGTKLNTNRGSVDIALQSPASEGLFFDREWILRDGKRLLWVPHSYRGARTGVAVQGRSVFIAQESGGFIFLKFAE